MSLDVVDLREFYASALGQTAAASINRVISEMVEVDPEWITVGVGYPIPILEALKLDQAACLMTARQGAVHWPDGKHSKTALVYENELPISNSSVDLVILFHVLENSSDPLETLQEVWRVLAPEGRILVVVPQRSGLWARFEKSPFGNGRPFSHRQMRGLLRDAKFTPVNWSNALNFPPLKSNWSLRLSTKFEKVTGRIIPAISGAIVVEATKRLYQGIPAGTKKRGKVFVPVLAPQGASREKS